MYVSLLDTFFCMFLALGIGMPGTLRPGGLLFAWALLSQLVCLCWDVDGVPSTCVFHAVKTALHHAACLHEVVCIVCL